MKNLLYETLLGKYYVDDSTQILETKHFKELVGQVQLILTSPPFPLNNKKKYGNHIGAEYKEWFVGLADIFSKLLKNDGSIIIELGNSWEPGRPVQSLLHLESLLEFVNHPTSNFRLCQQFICYNPARLPSPAQWVNIERIRVIDSFTHVWWIAKQDHPKADNKKVLRPYSKSMKKLLDRKQYNSGKRPSEHVIGKSSFLNNNDGSIMPNVIELEQIDGDKELRLPKNVFSISNTQSNDFFLRKCRENNLIPHPARMPLELVSFFIEFLTDPGDIVLDPFAGSNSTGFCAEKLSRKWFSVDLDKDYGTQSILRFEDPAIKTEVRKYFI
jgi:site-specific DNA-methyltransferase (cytosine-N4-specific)